MCQDGDNILWIICNIFAFMRNIQLYAINIIGMKFAIVNI